MPPLLFLFLHGFPRETLRETHHFTCLLLGHRGPLRGAMPSQFEDAEEEAPARVAPMAQSLLAQVGPWRHAQRARCASPPHSLVSRTRCLWQEASKYGTRTAAPAPQYAAQYVVPQP